MTTHDNALARYIFADGTFVEFFESINAGKPWDTVRGMLAKIQTTTLFDNDGTYEIGEPVYIHGVNGDPSEQLARDLATTLADVELTDTGLIAGGKLQ